MQAPLTGLSSTVARAVAEAAGADASVLQRITANSSYVCGCIERIVKLMFFLIIEPFLAQRRAMHLQDPLLT